GGRAEPVWVPPATLARAGIASWDALPGWVAPGDEAECLHNCDVSAALDAGLVRRPVEETVADTWRWMQALPPRHRFPSRPDLPRRGLSAEQEQSVWWLMRRD